MFDDTGIQVFSEPSEILRDERRTNWFWDTNDVFNSDLTAYAKLVRLYLARCANRTRQAWPSLNTIAKNCGVSRPTVKRAIAELVEKGWLRKYVRRRESMEYESTVYALLDPPRKTDEGRVSQNPPVKTERGRVPQNPPAKTEQGRVSQTPPAKIEQGGFLQNLPPQESPQIRRDRDNRTGSDRTGVGSHRPQVGSDRPYVGSEVYSNNTHRTIHNEQKKEKRVSSLREDEHRKNEVGLLQSPPTRKENEEGQDGLIHQEQIEVGKDVSNPNITCPGGKLFGGLLDLELPEPEKKKRPTRKKDSKKTGDPRVKKAIENHCELFSHKFGRNYVANFAKDGKLFKNLLKTLDTEFPDQPDSALSELLSLQARFFESDDEWIVSSGYNVGVFISVINKLRIAGRVKMPRAFASLDRWARDRAEKEGAVFSNDL